jgi:hypothetical protein
MSTVAQESRFYADETQQASAVSNLVVGWERKHAAQWGHVPVCLGHRLHTSPLFSRAALAELIDRYPRQYYSIIHMGALNGDRRFWREGDLGGMPGDEVINAIEKGRLWLNLRRAGDVDKRYEQVIDDLLDELGALAPDFVTTARGCGIIISSPNAQVYFHADLPGHTLLQIAGRKRVYFYPPHPPFVTPDDLERISIFQLEVDLPYFDWFDEYAQIYEFEPGQMLYWPHTAPHRIENYDSLNVSVTANFVTSEIRRRQKVIMANGILRHRFGWQPQGNSTHGPSFWTKNVLQRTLRGSNWIKRRRQAKHAVEFKLDATAPDHIGTL